MYQVCVVVHYDYGAGVGGGLDAAVSFLALG